MPPLSIMAAAALVAAGAAAAVYGTATTGILDIVQWQPFVAWQFAALTCIAWMAVCVSWVAAYLQRLRFEALLLALFAVAAVMLFGPMAVAALVMFTTAGAVVGTVLTARRSAAAPELLLRTLAGIAILAVALTWASPWPVNTAGLQGVAIVAVLAFGAASERVRTILRFDVSALALSASGRGGAAAPTLPEFFAYGWIATILAWLMAFAALPERYADGLSLHLYIPSYMASHWRWSYDAVNYAFAYIPAAADHLYTHFFLLAGEQGARLYNFLAIVLVCHLVYRLCRRETSRLAALLAVALIASTPVTFIETASLFVENSLALWITAAVYGLTRVWNDPRGSNAIVLALLAAACATKLHGALAAVVIGIPLAVVVWRKTSRRDFSIFAALAACFALFGAFPYLNAWIGTGNPLFPFYNDIFQAADFEPTRFVDGRWIGRFDWRLLYATVFESTSYMEAWPGAAGLTWLIFLPAAILVTLVHRSLVSTVCLGIGLVIILIVFSQIQYLRYVFPVLPLLAVPIALLLDRLGRVRGCGVILVPVIAAVAIFNHYKMPSAGWILGDTNLRALYDGEARQELEASATAERLFNRIVNDLDGPCARVLYTTGPSGALLQGTAVYSGWISGHYRRQGAWIKTIDDAEKYLRDLAITYVIHRSGADNAIADLLVAAVHRSGRLIASVRGVQLYSVAP